MSPLLWIVRFFRHYLLSPVEEPAIVAAPAEDDPELLFAPFDGGIPALPKTRAQTIKVFGDLKHSFTAEGKVKVSAAWERANMVIVPAAAIPGYGKRIYMHRLVEPYFREAMRRAAIACPEYVISKIGCFNPRFMRHDKRRPLTTHSWGMAFDLNDFANKAFNRKPGDPLPFEPGWEAFSDLPEGVVRAFESVGFVWGGRWGLGKKGGFCDPMHFQLGA